MAGLSITGLQKLSCVAFLLVVCALFGAECQRTCKEADMCCKGQNNTCYLFGPRMDGNYNESRCYCDGNCLIMGDCCIDFHTNCEAVDCKVADWGKWSDCDNPCGVGSKKRTRKVSQYPENGGKQCPVLKQRQACVGDGKADECLQQSVENQFEELHETARILPAKYGYFRTSKEYDPWKGILKNLYSRTFNEINTRPTYCARFVVTSTRSACNVSAATEQNSTWSEELKENQEVCVECQPTAMDVERGLRCIGHGVFDKQTRWSAIDVPHCHGKWMMTSKHEACVCDKESDINLILI
ncbi:hypothetical protein SNE40_004253 [Patella caerulea]|uniref:SMB domain-containing protein n=1 Tax=Patella caerulea TaxID=87958 RepID=A0AAN8KFQ8_PATCE